MRHINFRLISNFREVLKTATLKDTGIVFVGNLISSVLGAVFFFLLAHQGGPYVLGIFGVSIAVAITIADLFDVAIDNAMITFGSRSEVRGQVLRNGLFRKIVLSCIASILLWIFSSSITKLLGKPELLGAIRMAIWLVPTKSLYGFVKTVFQISRKFHFDAGIEVFSSLIRLFGFLIIFIVKIPVLALAFWAYIGSLVVAILIVLPVIIPVLKEKSQGVGHQAFTSYQLWMTLSFAASSISSRLDIFFLTRFTSLETVGWYQAAFRLFMPVQQLAGSLTRVFAPRLASFHDALQARRYLKKALLLTGFLSLSMLIPTPIFSWAIPLLYGSRFQGAIPIAYGLVLFFMVFLFSTPWWSVLLYFHSRARMFALLSIIGLLLQLVLFPSTIFLFGVHGAAIALLLSNIILTILVARKSRI